MRVARQPIFAALCFSVVLATSPVSAQFMSPHALANSAASMGAVAHQSSGPEALALWNVSNQFTYATRTGGTWSSPS